jgi:hypothetical protein
MSASGRKISMKIRFIAAAGYQVAGIDRN